MEVAALSPCVSTLQFRSVGYKVFDGEGQMLGRVFGRVIEVLPYALLSIDAVYAYDSSWVAVFLLLSLTAGILLRGFLGDVLCDCTVQGEEGLSVLFSLDLFLFPALLCNAMSWPPVYVGATVLTIFAVFAMNRLSKEGAAVTFVLSLVGIALLLLVMVLSASSPVSVVPHVKSLWVAQKGYSWMLCFWNVVLLASRPSRWWSRDVSPVERTVCIVLEVVLVLLLFMSSRCLFRVPERVYGVHFATFEVVEDDASRSLRLLSYCMLLIVVFFATGDYTTEKNKVLSLETDVLSLAWVSIIFIPLLQLSPFVIFPWCAGLIRALRIFDLFKRFSLEGPRDGDYRRLPMVVRL